MPACETSAPTTGRYSELTEVYDELEEATAVQRRLGCPVIDISELSIEETAQRILRTVEGRKAEAAAAEGHVTAKPPVPWWRWAIWWMLLGLSLLVFYVAAHADLAGAERACVAGGVPLAQTPRR